MNGGELMPEGLKKMQHLASVGPSFEPSHHFICAILFCLLILPCWVLVYISHLLSYNITMIEEGAHLTGCQRNAGMDWKLGLHQTSLLPMHNEWRGTDA